MDRDLHIDFHAMEVRPCVLIQPKLCDRRRHRRCNRQNVGLHLQLLGPNPLLERSRQDITNLGQRHMDARGLIDDPHTLRRRPDCQLSNHHLQ